MVNKLSNFFVVPCTTPYTAEQLSSFCPISSFFRSFIHPLPWIENAQLIKYEHADNGVLINAAHFSAAVMCLHSNWFEVFFFFPHQHLVNVWCRGRCRDSAFLYVIIYFAVSMFSLVLFKGFAIFFSKKFLFSKTLLCLFRSWLLRCRAIVELCVCLFFTVVFCFPSYINAAH